MKNIIVEVDIIKKLSTDFTHSPIALWSTINQSRTYKGYAFNVSPSAKTTDANVNYLPGGNPDELQILNFAGTGDADVKTWYDSIGSSDLTLSSGTEPTLSESGVINKDNNVQTVKFNGVSDLSSNDSDLHITGDLSILMVLKFASADTEERIIGCAGSSEVEADNFLYHIYRVSSGNIFYFHEHGAGVDLGASWTTQALNDTDEHVLLLTRNATDKELKLYIDGVLIESAKSYSDNPTGGSSGLFALGCTYPTNTANALDGNIKLCGIYNNDISEDANSIYKSLSDAFKLSSDKKQFKKFVSKANGSEDGYLTGKLKYSVIAKTWVHSEITLSKLSEISIANADGSQDGLCDLEFNQARVYEELNGTKSMLAVGYAHRAIMQDDKIIKLPLKDATELLNVPLQSQRFPSSELSDSSALQTNTYYSAEKRQRPICIGYCFNIPPFLANRSINEYWVHDADYHDVVLVYDNGIGVTYTDHDRSFTLNADPSGKILADVKGEVNSSISPQAEIKSIKDVITYVFEKAGITNYSSSDLDDINTDKNYELSYYHAPGTASNLNEVLKWLVNSFTGWFYTGSNGDIRFGFLKEPKLTADIEINKYNVIGSIRIIDDVAPNIKTRIGCQRNWDKYEQDNIAFGASESNKIDLSQSHRYIAESDNGIDNYYSSSDDIHDSLISLQSNADTEADNIATLFSKKRRFYIFDCDLKVNIGDTIKLTHTRKGLNNGKNLLVTGYEIDFIVNTVYRVYAWG